MHFSKNNVSTQLAELFRGDAAMLARSWGSYCLSVCYGRRTKFRLNKIFYIVGQNRLTWLTLKYELYQETSVNAQTDAS